LISLKANTLSLRNKLSIPINKKAFLYTERLFYFIQLSYFLYCNEVNLRLLNSNFTMNYILFDGPYRNNLLPFTYTRPVADIRVGILTIRQKWESYLEYTTTTVTEDYLADKFPMVEMEENIMINASFLPNMEVAEFVKNLTYNQALFKGEDVIAFFAKEGEEVKDFSTFEAVEFIDDILTIQHTWDIFYKNGDAISEDFNLITKDRQSQPIPATVNTINPENIFIEKGAILNFATLNASSGPIYIGRDAEVMEGSMVRGPLALCHNAT
jgi:hypothetical protein